jgi:hypothetical protein
MKTHFDISQHYVIFWDTEDIKGSAKELTDAVIRSFINI